MVRLASALAMAALALAPAVGRAATATVLNSSPLWADSQSYHVCTVVNVSASTVDVTIELVGANGKVIATTPTAFVALTAGEITEVENTHPYSGLARCQFTFTAATAVTVSPPIRANLTVFHTISAGVLQTYAVSEAR